MSQYGAMTDCRVNVGHGDLWFSDFAIHLYGYLMDEQLRPKKTIYVCFRFPRPYQGFCPDRKHFIVNFEKNKVKNQGKFNEKCSIYIKYFCKIKC